MDKNLLIQIAFFVVSFGIGFVGIRAAEKFIRPRVWRAVAVALFRGLFYTPTMILTTGIALVPSVFALLQWPFLFPALIVFAMSLYGSLKRGVHDFETDG